ncbi:MAG: 50S ribosomal protein L21 [Actinomycetales bacterium]|nr:50S ribosomal protein L21 [Actinomycetales bacterium]
MSVRPASAPFSRVLSPPGASRVTSRTRESSNVVYAIVKAGGRQEKVSVGDILVVDRLSAGTGETVQLPALLLVDGDKVTSDAKALAKVSVTAEVVRDERGPKIDILRYKNKTGYRRRQGHRQELTRLKVTGIK